jgi:hypothetical protein
VAQRPPRGRPGEKAKAFPVKGARAKGLAKEVQLLLRVEKRKELTASHQDQSPLQGRPKAGPLLLGPPQEARHPHSRSNSCLLKEERARTALGARSKLTTNSNRCVRQ